MKDLPYVSALLGDLVGSRDGDRVSSDQSLSLAIARTNATLPALDPLRKTVGDEFQGIYGSTGLALSAAYLLSETMWSTVEVRIGVGRGEVRFIDTNASIQDGSAWWKAREALVEVEKLSHKPGYSHRRIMVSLSDGHSDECLAPINSLLSLIDTQIGRLKPETRRTLDWLLQQKSGLDIARIEGVSQSAVSQRISNNNLYVLVDAIRSLERLP